MLAAESDAAVDATRLTRMLLVHDLAEAFTGDITPHDQITGEVKNRVEQSAFDLLAARLGRDEMTTLWREYHDNLTATAHLARDLDFLETLLQAIEYEATGQLKSNSVEEFWAVAGTRVLTPFGRRLLMTMQFVRRHCLLEVSAIASTQTASGGPNVRTPILPKLA
jgi:putative hydrolases of HD superfamily